MTNEANALLDTVNIDIDLHDIFHLIDITTLLEYHTYRECV